MSEEISPITAAIFVLEAVEDMIALAVTRNDEGIKDSLIEHVDKIHNAIFQFGVDIYNATKSELKEYDIGKVTELNRYLDYLIKEVGESIGESDRWQQDNV